MMIYPPIDKMVEQVGCKYALVCLVTKRARFLLDKKGEQLNDINFKSVTAAAHDVYDGKVEARQED